MGKYLIGGRAGSGKSSVATELRPRGFNAYDGDHVSGLAHWEDVTTGTVATLTDYTHVDTSRYHWLWDKNRLNELLAQQQEVILCGSANNDLDFADCFDRIFALDVRPEVHANRLRTRTDNNYGRSETMIPKIVAEQQDFIQRALALGAVAIDAEQPLETVVDDIITYVHGHH